MLLLKWVPLPGNGSTTSLLYLYLMFMVTVIVVAWCNEGGDDSLTVLSDQQPGGPRLSLVRKILSCVTTLILFVRDGSTNAFVHVGDV